MTTKRCSVQPHPWIYQLGQMPLHSAYPSSGPMDRRARGARRDKPNVVTLFSLPVPWPYGSQDICTVAQQALC